MEYIIARLVEGVVDFALHCMDGMDGIPGFSFERVEWWCLELLLGDKNIVDERVMKKTSC